MPGELGYVSTLFISGERETPSHTKMWFLAYHFRPRIVTLAAFVLSDDRPSLIDYIAVSGTMERNVLEFVDHLHEHFIHPCSINSNGRYNVPTKEDEGYRSVTFSKECVTSP